MSTPTYEEINTAFMQLDVAKHGTTLKQFTPAMAAANPANVLGSVCPIYKAVRPFLQAAAALPFIPAAWRAGITAFITAMDLLCP
jgi:hypothetical protein